MSIIQVQKHVVFELKHVALKNSEKNKKSIVKMEVARDSIKYCCQPVSLFNYRFLKET